MADQGAAVIVGVGSGLGIALCRRFAAAGHPIAMVAREADRLQSFAGELEATGAQVKAYPADATNEEAMITLFDAVENELGPVNIAVHNVNGRVVKSILEMESGAFEDMWRSVCLGGMHTGREAARRMVGRGQGSIFFTGGRGSRVGLDKFAAFAVAKFGLRALAQSMARELGPQGIHVAHFTVEATIDKEPFRSNNLELANDEGMVDTDALAEAYYQTHIQPRSCWTFENDLRPWREEFL